MKNEFAMRSVDVRRISMLDWERGSITHMNLIITLILRLIHKEVRKIIGHMITVSGYQEESGTEGKEK